MSPPNIRPLTIQELNALYRRLINNEGIPNVFSDIEYHKDEFVQPGAQEYIRRIRESINENEFEQYSSRTITALRSLIRTKINPMEGLIPFDSIIPSPLGTEVDVVNTEKQDQRHERSEVVAK